MKYAANPSKYAREFISYQNVYHLNPVLSLTCGNAEDELYLAQSGLNVSAIDNDLIKIEKVKSTVASTKLCRLQVFHADILQPLPFESHSFKSLYWKFGLHFFSRKEIQQVIIPELARLLRPNSLASVVYRYVDLTQVDKNRFDITINPGQQVIFEEKTTRKTIVCYIWDELTVKNWFSAQFDIIEAKTQMEELYNKVSNVNKSTIVSLLLSLK
ncbi:MAG: class I SAM-dependent methyltransferase [Dehalococcoidales bacterium]|nr:class I SAM-dependent methyltransferase [Dehalococcoidales bacterium]